MTFALYEKCPKTEYLSVFAPNTGKYEPEKTRMQKRIWNVFEHFSRSVAYRISFWKLIFGGRF